MIDFAQMMWDKACPHCGAEAYFQASPEGYMHVRWRCEHAAWADEDARRELAALARERGGG